MGEVSVLKDAGLSRQGKLDVIYESGCGRIGSSGDRRFIKTLLVHRLWSFPAVAARNKARIGDFSVSVCRLKTKPSGDSGMSRLPLSLSLGTKLQSRAAGWKSQ